MTLENHTFSPETTPYAATRAELDLFKVQFAESPEVQAAFQDQITQIQRFTDTEQSDLIPDLPSPAESAVLLQPETAAFLSGMFDHLSAQGYPDWLIEMTVTVTSTVRSQEHTIAIYNQYIAEGEAIGDAAQVQRWTRIRQRLISGAQDSHTTGRKFDLVVSQGRLNRASQWYNETGIYQDVVNYLDTGNEQGFGYDIHGGHFDIYSTRRHPQDETYETNLDIKRAIAAANRGPSQRTEAEAPTGITQAAILPTNRIIAAGARVAEQLSVTSEPDMVVDEANELNPAQNVTLASQFSRVRLRSQDNPNFAPRNIGAGEIFSCPNGGMFKTGAELDLEESLAQTQFLCVEDQNQNRYWTAVDYLTNI